MIRLKAHAKINLSLDVVGERADGYHDLRSVMQSIRLADEIILKPAKDIRIRCDLHFIPRDETNIAYKAAKLFCETVGTSDGVYIQIQKRIPVGGGLGGGSADAAAVLMGLNRLNGFPLSFVKLQEIGLSCGADVPFCMHGGTCLAEGLGEKLTALPPMPHCHIVLIRPNFSLNTKKMFALVETEAIRQHPDTEGLINALKNRDYKGVATRLYNTLEPFAPREEIVSYKKALLQLGADAALMTGSGSVVYGVFHVYEAAQEANAYFSSQGIHARLTAPIASVY